MDNSMPEKSKSLQVMLGSLLVRGFLALLLGILAAAFPEVRQYFASHIGLLVFLYLAYLILLIPYSVAKEIWRRRKESIVSQLAQLMQIKLSSFYKRYKERLIAYNQNFSIQGLSVQSPYSLELRKVFIELNIQLLKSERDHQTFGQSS